MVTVNVSRCTGSWGLPRYHVKLRTEVHKRLMNDRREVDKPGIGRTHTHDISAGEHVNIGGIMSYTVIGWRRCDCHPTRRNAMDCQRLGVGAWQKRAAREKREKMVD